MRNAFKAFFAWKYSYLASTILGMAWVVASMEALSLIAPVHPAWFVVVIVPALVWLSLAAAMYDRYRVREED